MKVLKQILKEMIVIRKELQAIRRDLELKKNVVMREPYQRRYHLNPSGSALDDK